MSGRKVEDVTVPAEWGARDKGKVYRITEASAAQAEKWGYRLVIALKGTTAAIPESIAPLGLIAVAIRGFNSFLAADVDFAKLEPLLDEMMSCVQIIRDRSVPYMASPLISDDDIEEVKTIMWLRSEVLRIHTNFSLVEAALTWVASMKPPTDSPNT